MNEPEECNTCGVDLDEDEVVDELGNCADCAAAPREEAEERSAWNFWRR